MGEKSDDYSCFFWVQSVVTGCLVKVYKENPAPQRYIVGNGRENFYSL